MSFLFSYYLAGLALLLLALPLGLGIFEARPDRGWAGARLLGLVLAVLLHRLAGPVQAEPALSWALLPVLLLLAGCCAYVACARQAVRTALAGAWRSILGIELVFICTFAAAALLTAHDPALFGTERLMDMAVLQTVSIATSFPPPDPWLAGEPLNYYWLGHHMALLPGLFANIPTAVVYNIALAYTFATLVQLACSLLLPAAGNLHRALLGGVMVGLAGNLHPIVRLATGLPDGNLHFDASRIIPGTITEFPLLSLLVGDLHAHFTMLPVVLLFALWLQAKPGGNISLAVSIAVVNLLFLATALGNPWNLAALLALFSAFKLLSATALPWWSPAPAMVLLPFAWPSLGPGMHITWLLPAQGSPLPEFLQVWGIPLLLLTGLVDWPAAIGKLKGTGFLWLIPPLALAFQSPPAGICLALALLLWLVYRPGEGLWAAMGIAAMSLLTVPELVYLRDGYPAPFERMNTVFKFSYSAWPLLMLAAARAALLVLDTAAGKLLPLLRAGLLLATGLLLVYCARAVPQRLAAEITLPLWDGVAALKQRHPEDVGLVQWLAPRMNPGDICLEAPGVSYQWSGRISALTGCATVLGWESHERLWRDRGDDIGARREDVERLYTTTDPLERRRLLERYGIDWVIVGEVERAMYGSQPPLVRGQFSEPAYTFGRSSIYRISRP